MDGWMARSAPQGAHHHADAIYLLPHLGIKKGARALWYSELSLHQIGSRPTVFIPRWQYTLAFYTKCVLYARRTTDRYRRQLERSFYKVVNGPLSHQSLNTGGLGDVTNSHKYIS